MLHYDYLMHIFSSRIKLFYHLFTNLGNFRGDLLTQYTLPFYFNHDLHYRCWGNKGTWTWRKSNLPIGRLQVLQEQSSVSPPQEHWRCLQDRPVIHKAAWRTERSEKSVLEHRCGGGTQNYLKSLATWSNGKLIFLLTCRNQGLDG